MADYGFTLDALEKSPEKTKQDLTEKMEVEEKASDKGGGVCVFRVVIQVSSFTV